MKFTILIVAYIFLFSADSHAARCKIDGVWYSYDSPECSPERPEQPKPLKTIEPEEAPTAALPSGPVNQVIDGPMFDHLHPWDQVVYQVENRCKQKQAVHSVRSTCALQEEMSYWAMHGNFEMPETFAYQAKVLCTGKTKSFSSQSGCMQAESYGYRIFTGEFEMPPDVVKKARAQCLQEHQSLQLIGRCMNMKQRKYQKELDIAAGKSFRSDRPRSRVLPQAVFDGRNYKEPGYATESEISTFIVDPAAQPPVQSATRDLTPPEPLHISQRAYHLGIRSADFPTMEAFQAHMDRSTDYFVLTMSEPVGEGGNYLSLVDSRHFNPNLHAGFGMDRSGWAWLHLVVEEGRSYLIDFVVESYGAGSYRLKVESNEFNLEDLGGSYDHVTALLKASSSGEARVGLTQDVGSGFNLYAVAVTSAASGAGE